MKFRHTGDLEAFLIKVLNRKLLYSADAYSFVLDALDFTIKKIKTQRHLSAVELLEGIRQYSIKMFGPMTKTVFEEWKIKSCEDFGEIVFDLVICGLITKQDSDLKSDFKNGFNFQEAFEKPFLV